MQDMLVAAQLHSRPCDMREAHAAEQIRAHWSWAIWAVRWRGAELLQTRVSLLRGAQICLQMASQLPQPAQPGVLALQVGVQAAGCVPQDVICSICHSMQLGSGCQLVVRIFPARERQRWSRISMQRGLTHEQMFHQRGHTDVMWHHDTWPMLCGQGLQEAAGFSAADEQRGPTCRWPASWPQQLPVDLQGAAASLHASAAHP